jgi:hypothetical protein
VIIRAAGAILMQRVGAEDSVPATGCGAPVRSRRPLGVYVDLPQLGDALSIRGRGLGRVEM